MAGRRLRIVVTIVVLGGLVGLAPAGAGAAPGREGVQAHAANFPASIAVTVPPGGTATVTSPDLGEQKALKVQMTATNDRIFDTLALALAQDRTPGQRVMRCIMVYTLIVDGQTDGEDAQFEVDRVPLATLFVSACLKLAVRVTQIKQESGAARAAARAPCAQLGRQVAAKITRTGRLYSVKVKGRIRKGSSRGTLRVGCVRTARGLTLSIRPRAKGKTLRSVLGKKLNVGVANTATTGAGAPLKVTFRAG